MTISELISHLQELDGDLEVRIHKSMICMRLNTKSLMPYKILLTNNQFS